MHKKKLQNIRIQEYTKNAEIPDKCCNNTKNAPKYKSSADILYIRIEQLQKNTKYTTTTTILLQNTKYKNT